MINPNKKPLKSKLDLRSFLIRIIFYHNLPKLNILIQNPEYHCNFFVYKHKKQYQALSTSIMLFLTLYREMLAMQELIIKG